MVSSTRGLADEDLLEAALQGGVLLDVLAVLVEGGGADHAQLAPGQHRLDHVAGVHGPLGRAGADDGVELVDEGDDLALGVGDLLEDGLQPLLELAPVLGPGHHAAEVEADEPAVAQALGHVALDDAAGQALDDGGLAHAGLADEHRVVLGAAGQDLDDAADLLVAADDRVELALAGVLGEVPAVLLERLELVLGVLAGDPVAAPHLDAARRAARPGRRRPGRPGPAGGARWRGTRRSSCCALVVGPVEDLAEVGPELGLGRRSCGAGGPGPPGRGCAARAAGARPSAGSGRTTPSAWPSRAASRWSGVTSGLLWALAASTAWVTASWVFSVQRFGSSAMTAVYGPTLKLDKERLKFSASPGSLGMFADDGASAPVRTVRPGRRGDVRCRDGGHGPGSRWWSRRPS